MSIKQKIKNLWKNHKEEIIAGSVILGCVGVGVALDHYDKKTKVESVETVETVEPAPSPAPELPEWDPRWMKNWNTMVELAQRLELDPGESYVIDEGGLSKMNSGVIIGHNAITHYVDGYECYPDEEWWERYFNGDTPFTGDDKYAKLNRFVYMMNNAGFKPGDMFTYGRKSNGDYFMGFDNFTDSGISFFKNSDDPDTTFFKY